MKRLFLLLPALLILGFNTFAQESRCGFDLLVSQMDAGDKKDWNTQFAAQVKSALANGASALKTAGNAPVPVVFHYLVTAVEKVQMRNDTGIISRVQSQLQALNEDFNAQNADQANIPSGFKPLFGNAGISFALANGTSAYTIAKGIEVRTISTSGGYDFTTGFADAKRLSEGGLDGWDGNKYLNIWVFNTGNQLLGLAVPKSFIGSSFGGGITITPADIGVAVHYRAAGRRQSVFDSYIPNNDLGRTLTHEVGHFFYLRHIWGDQTGCSADDGIGDTPRQSDPTYCQNGCPTYPFYDNCSPTGNGVMFMNYMDYTDDRALNMFTKTQTSLMKSLVSSGGPLEGLTTNPALTSALSVSNTPAGKGGERLLSLYPNPATTTLFVENTTNGPIENFTLSDVTGREVVRVALLQNSGAEVSLINCAPGLYFVRATVGGVPFAGKVVVR